MPSPHLRFKLWAIMLAIAAAALLLTQFKAWHNASPPVATVVGSFLTSAPCPNMPKAATVSQFGTTDPSHFGYS